MGNSLASWLFVALRTIGYEDFVLKKKQGKNKKAKKPKPTKQQVQKPKAEVISKPVNMDFQDKITLELVSLIFGSIFIFAWCLATCYFISHMCGEFQRGRDRLSPPRRNFLGDAETMV